MEILFIHPNFPGQFRRLAAALAREEKYTVHGVGDEQWTRSVPQLDNVPLLTYPNPAATGLGVHAYAKSFDAAVRRGQQVVQTLLAHKRQGLEPEVIFVHPGWGDGFYLKDIFPGSKVVGFFEYYYRTRGADVGFDPEFPISMDDIFRVHSLNATQLLALQSCDVGYCPTFWQRRCFPAQYRQRLQVIHDGIDTETVKPDPQACITLPDGSVHRAGEEILTYVARNLEPYRGFHIFMRALPKIMSERPNCRVIIVGGDGVSYGKTLPAGETYRARYLAELAGQLDLSRIHFTGTLPYDEYLKVLQVSRVHTYLTYPFILSWSMLEAMASGCLLLASGTPSVREVIKEGENGLLFPFKNPDALAKLASEALASPERYRPLRAAARRSVVKQYDFNSVCYPQFKKLIQELQI